MKTSTFINNISLIAALSINLACIDSAECADNKKQGNKASAAVDNQTPVTPMDQPLILVDGSPITSRDYVGFLQAKPEIISRAVNSERGKAEALKEMVSAFLLQKAIYDEGLLSKEEKNVGQKQFSEAYEKLAERHFPLPPKTEEAEGFSYYKAHENEFGIPPSYRLNEILIKVNPESDDAVKKSLKDKAESILARINSGEKIAQLATGITENPIGKVASGDIGFVNPLEEPWLNNALKDMKVGHHTGVVASPEGFVILEVTDIRGG